MAEKQKRTNVRLSMKEDFELTKWLKDHQMEPGEQIADLVAKAKAETGIQTINYNHVQQRMLVFGIKLLSSTKLEPSEELAQLRERFAVMEHRVFALEQTIAKLRSADVQGK